jgi:hypothetical protein
MGMLFAEQRLDPYSEHRGNARQLLANPGVDLAQDKTTITTTTTTVPLPLPKMKRALTESNLPKQMSVKEARERRVEQEHMLATQGYSGGVYMKMHIPPFTPSTATAKKRGWQFVSTVLRARIAFRRAQRAQRTMHQGSPATTWKEAEAKAKAKAAAGAEAEVEVEGRSTKRQKTAGLAPPRLHHHACGMLPLPLIGRAVSAPSESCLTDGNRVGVWRHRLLSSNTHSDQMKELLSPRARTPTDM